MLETCLKNGNRFIKVALKCTTLSVLYSSTDVRWNLICVPANKIIPWRADSYMTLSNTYEAAVWSHLRHFPWRIPHFHHQHLRPVLGSYPVLWPFGSAARPPGWSVDAPSTVHLSLHTIRLTEIHNKMPRGSFPAGGNYRGVSWWFRALVWGFSIIPRTNGIQGEMNEWLSKMASSILPRKRAKLNH